MDKNEVLQWVRTHVEFDEKSRELVIKVLQECDECGKLFELVYYPNGQYDYATEPCECSATFHPVVGPSLTQWCEGNLYLSLLKQE